MQKLISTDTNLLVSAETRYGEIITTGDYYNQPKDAINKTTQYQHWL